MKNTISTVLPREVRDNIYELVHAASPVNIFYDPAKAKNDDTKAALIFSSNAINNTSNEPLSVLFLVSKKIAYESRLRFLTSVTFVIHLYKPITAYYNSSHFLRAAQQDHRASQQPRNPPLLLPMYQLNKFIAPNRLAKMNFMVNLGSTEPSPSCTAECYVMVLCKTIVEAFNPSWSALLPRRCHPLQFTFFVSDRNGEIRGSRREFTLNCSDFRGSFDTIAGVLRDAADNAEDEWYRKILDRASSPFWKMDTTPIDTLRPAEYNPRPAPQSQG